MSRRLVIHIGAQKCASSSLQASLRLYQAACDKNLFSFVFLNPAQLRAASDALTLKKDAPFQYIDRILSGLKGSFSVVSHEMLGNRPALVQAIARRALRQHSFDHVVVVGYTRLQSSYHISAFKQWFFRDHKKLRHDISVLKNLELPWRKFSSLERSLFALAVSGRDRSWFANYKKFLAGCASFSDQLTISSNHIPTKSNPYLLLEDFFRLSDYECVDDLSSYDVRKNISFHPVVVHALSAHFASLGSRVSCFPGPHEGNRWLFRICDRLDNVGGDVGDEKEVFPADFVRSIVDYLDHFNYSNNLKYCRLMSVDESYFKPSDSSDSLLSKDQLVHLAHRATESRDQKKIDDYLLNSENLFMNAARAEIIST